MIMIHDVYHLVLLSFNLYPILITVFGAMPCGEQTQHRPASHWIQSPESRPLTVEPQGADPGRLALPKVGIYGW